MICSFPENLDEYHQNNLCQNNADKHGQRVDGGIAYRSLVASLIGIVHIAQCHRVGHTAAEHTASGTEIHFAEALGNPAHQSYRYESNGKADTDPCRSFGAHDGFKEMSSGINTQTGQIER